MWYIIYNILYSTLIIHCISFLYCILCSISSHSPFTCSACHQCVRECAFVCTFYIRQFRHRKTRQAFHFILMFEYVSANYMLYVYCRCWCLCVFLHRACYKRIAKIRDIDSIMWQKYTKNPPITPPCRREHPSSRFPKLMENKCLAVFVKIIYFVFGFFFLFGLWLVSVLNNDAKTYQLQSNGFVIAHTHTETYAR